MTTAKAQAERAQELHGVAVELHGVAEQLERVNTKQDRNRVLLLGVVIEGVLLLAALVIIGFLAQPIIRTARTVQNVAGPAAQARNAAQTDQFLTFFLCTQRANTSESRVADGKDPLPLRDGCPPYDFSPHQPVLPTTTTTTPSRPRARRTTSTTTRATTTTTAPGFTPAATTTTCPTVVVADRCVGS